MEIDREQDAVPLIEEAVQQTRVHFLHYLKRTIGIAENMLSVTFIDKNAVYLNKHLLSLRGVV
jgi:hypothetical protein